MLRHRFTRVGSLGSGLAALLLASGLATAAPPGGHGGGGPGAGGAHSSSGGHWSGGTHGYYHYGNWGGYHHHYYPGFYGFYFGFDPWFYGGYYPARYYDYFPEYYGSAYVAGAPRADYQSYYSPQASAQDQFVPDPNAVMIGVRIPPNAELWFDGDKTSQTGVFREFVSPPLETGKTYNYELKARWTREDGSPVEQKRTVAVHAGQRVGVDFLSPPPVRRKEAVP
jgi:uncharacterized protein (TIGR03000 family)